MEKNNQYTECCPKCGGQMEKKCSLCDKEMSGGDYFEVFISLVIIYLAISAALWCNTPLIKIIAMHWDFIVFWK